MMKFKIILPEVIDMEGWNGKMRKEEGLAKNFEPDGSWMVVGYRPVFHGVPQRLTTRNTCKLYGTAVEGSFGRL